MVEAKMRAQPFGRGWSRVQMRKSLSYLHPVWITHFRPSGAMMVVTKAMSTRAVNWTITAGNSNR